MTDTSVNSPVRVSDGSQTVTSALIFNQLRYDWPLWDRGNVWDSARTLHQNTAYVYHVAVCFQQKPVESSVKVTQRVTNGNGTKSLLVDREGEISLCCW